MLKVVSKRKRKAHEAFYGEPLEATLLALYKENGFSHQRYIEYLQAETVSQENTETMDSRFLS